MSRILKILTILLYVIILGFIFIFLSNKIQQDDRVLKFVLSEDGGYVNGEIITPENFSFFTENGVIRLKGEEANFTTFKFKVYYAENYHYFDYDYDGEKRIKFIVLVESLKSGKYALNSRNFSVILYDNKTRCPLYSKVYLNGFEVGHSIKGRIIIYESQIKNKSNYSSLEIFGLTDSCFDIGSDIPFYSSWMIYPLEEYFFSGDDLVLYSNLHPRQPQSPTEMKAFIRPTDVKSSLKEEYFSSNNDEDVLDSISSNYMTYYSDYEQFGYNEYWQTPTETLRSAKGDCEDWAITTLSLMRAFKENISCYDIIWQTHMSVLCRLDNTFIIYDQGKVKSKTTLNKNPHHEEIIMQENKIKFREMLNDYFDKFGLDPNERKASAIFNDEDMILFKENDSFLNWVLNII